MTHLNRPVRIIGIDVATQPKNVGLAHCILSDGGLELTAVAAHATWDAIDAELTTWLDGAGAECPTVLALDAPLGWPAPLASALREHRAGGALPPLSNALFRRRTDDVVASALGKRPLDVGADRIARTAHTALQLLERLREKHRLDIPLAWRPTQPTTTSTIEVYPAGTLVSRSLPSSRYKGTGAEAVATRERIIEGIQAELTLTQESLPLMRSSDHLLDAVLCCIAGRDFVDARVIEPDDLALAQQEGWIWVAPRR